MLMVRSIAEIRRVLRLRRSDGTIPVTLFLRVRRKLPGAKSRAEHSHGADQDGDRTGTHHPYSIGAAGSVQQEKVLASDSGEGEAPAEPSVSSRPRLGRSRALPVDSK
jgi:hypothetical protein